MSFVLFFCFFFQKTITITDKIIIDNHCYETIPIEICFLLWDFELQAFLEIKRLFLISFSLGFLHRLVFRCKINAWKKDLIVIINLGVMAVFFFTIKYWITFFFYSKTDKKKTQTYVWIEEQLYLFHSLTFNCLSCTVDVCGRICVSVSEWKRKSCQSAAKAGW